MNPMEAELCSRLAMAQRLGDHAGAATALFELGQAAKHDGDLGLATERFLSAATEFQAAGQGRNLLSALNNAATGAMAQGDWTTAMGLFHQCLDLATEIDDGNAIRRAVGNLASLCSDADQVEDALTYHLMAVGMAQQLADAAAAARSLHNAAWACMRLGQFGRAQEYLARAGIFLEASNELELQAIVALMQARLDMRSRRWERARMEMVWADRVLDTVSTPEWRSHAVIALAMLDEISGVFSPVTERLMTALPALSSVSGRHTTARRLLGLSCIAAEQGRTGASQSYAGLAAICADGARDPGLRDLAGHIRDALAGGTGVDPEAAAHGSACALELRPVPGEPAMPSPPVWKWLTLT